MLSRSLKSSHLLRTSIKWNPGATSLYSSSADDAKKPVTGSKSDRTTETTAKKSTVADNKTQAAKQKLADLLSSLKTDSVASSDSAHQDLTHKLNLAKPNLRNKKLNENQEAKPTSKYITSEVMDAVDSVAASLGGDAQNTKSELLQKLESHAKTTEQIKKAKLTLSDLVSGMKVEAKKVERTQGAKTKPGKESRRTEQRFEKRENVFTSGKPIGLFTPVTPPSQSTTSATTSQVSFTPTFDALAKRELQLMTTHPPRNGFEEMIQWTEQGKLWLFPINNEQGLDEEAKVGFHEHVFLEHHLQGWCPRRGPIRHFMELVCTGLSKNPYITVEQKKEHIMWFRDYFQGKEDILTEIGALEDKISLQA